ncbi:hypothetical protein [Streptomyces sp. NPDC055085]
MGVQLPRLSLVPPTQRSSAGRAAVNLAAVAGLHLDPWQQWIVERALGETDELYYNAALDKMMPRSSAYEIALIVARQNGKGSIMEALELAWLFLLGAEVVCHAAHEFATSKEHFQRIEGLVTDTPELKAELSPGGVKWSHGDESITLKPDRTVGRYKKQRLIFKTRTKSAARGFSIDKLVLDEAVILKQDAVKAMTYTTSARPDVQIMYAGSAGDQESEHFGRARARGMAGKEERLFFAEWSADLCKVMCPTDCTEHMDPQDPRTWAIANPALGYRIQHDGIASECARDPEGFKMERLSVGDWPVEGEAWRIIAKDLWDARLDEVSAIQDAPVFSIDISPDRRWSCIAAAGSNGAGGVHGEITGRFAPDGGSLLDYKLGVDWVVPRAIELHKRNPRSQWVIDKGTQAWAYWDELEKAGLKLVPMTLREHAQACGMFFSSVVPVGGSEPDFVHIGQTELTTAVANVETRTLSGLWAWDMREAGAPAITPLVAVTNACWGFRKLQSKKRPKPMAAWGR